METITKLVIPVSFDTTLKSKIAEVNYASNHRNLATTNVALQNCVTYARQQMHQAYECGLDQGKVEALHVIREELKDDS